MRLLIAVPHYFHFAPTAPGRHGSDRSAPSVRVRAVGNCLAAVQQQFGRPQCVIDLHRRTTDPANHRTAVTADVLVLTAGDRHLLDRMPLPAGYFTHIPTSIPDPRLLGYECHAALRDRLREKYDFYGYLEDDLVLRDPLFFAKLRWFVGRFGDGSVLMPNRYELARGGLVHKAYVDGPLRPAVTAGFQNVTAVPELTADLFGLRWVFRRPTNPHAGCFFLTHAQMATWAAQPDFLDRSAAFIGPLESAATLGVARAFRVYKPVPENAAFLEVEHAGTAFVGRIRMPPGGADSP